MKNITLPILFLITSSFSLVSTSWAQMAYPTCMPPSEYSVELFKKVLTETRKAIPLQVVFLCRSFSIPNAYAMPIPIFDQNGRLVGYKFTLYYNPLFMGQLDVSRNNEWAQIGVFAHEIGHFVETHNQINQGSGNSAKVNSEFQYNSSWSKELFADQHAGKILAGLGAESGDIEEAQRFLFTLHGSPTHPDTTSRLVALYKGFQDGGGKTENLPSPQDISKNIFDQISRW